MNSPTRRIWLNGKLLPWDEVQLHLLSHACARGALVFDYMRISETPRGPAFFRLDAHVQRFLDSCALVGLPLEYGAAELRAACLAAARANPGARVCKLHAFIPSIEIDVVPADARVSIAAAAYHPWEDVLARKHPPPAKAPAHARLFIERNSRQRRADILHPHAKVAANYAAPMAAKWRARNNGYDEVLLLDEAGMLTETPTANFFLVNAEGVLCTPPQAGVLPGVTRRSLLELARAENIAVAEKPLAPAELHNAAEAFLCGTSAGLWPVESVDGRAVGALCPGPVSARLAARFALAGGGRDAAFAHWLTLLHA